MSHDQAFAAHVERREAQRAAIVKVTWRKVSELTGGGWSGLGPDGELVWVTGPSGPLGFYSYGRVVEGSRDVGGGCPTLARAKKAAEVLMTEHVTRLRAQKENVMTDAGDRTAGSTDRAPGARMKRVIALTAPDGNRIVWAVLRGPRDPRQERDQIARARDWTRRMYGQNSEAIETVRVEDETCPTLARAKKAAEVLMTEHVQRLRAQKENIMSDTTPTAKALMEGIGEAVPNAKGTYHRLRVGKRTLGYADTRSDGYLLTVAGKDTDKAPAKLRRGLASKGDRLVLRVNAGNVKTARALVEWLAQA